MPSNQVSATAVIAAPPEQLFALLTDPAQHPLIDGTDSVLGVQDGGPARLTLGSKFGMNMKIGAPYKIENTVVEFEEGRRIAWRHFGKHVWRYILAEGIDVVPLYFAAERPVVRRGGTFIMVDDDRLPLAPGESPELRRVRFRTLGCYPLTGAIESDARTVEAIVAEMAAARTSERQGRLIDTDDAASMERKKREGYF